MGITSEGLKCSKGTKETKDGIGRKGVEGLQRVKELKGVARTTALKTVKRMEIVKGV